MVFRTVLWAHPLSKPLQCRSSPKWMNCTHSCAIIFPRRKNIKAISSCYPNCISLCHTLACSPRRVVDIAFGGMKTAISTTTPSRGDETSMPFFVSAAPHCCEVLAALLWVCSPTPSSALVVPEETSTLDRFFLLVVVSSMANIQHSASAYPRLAIPSLGIFEMQGFELSKEQILSTPLDVFFMTVHPKIAVIFGSLGGP